MSFRISIDTGIHMVLCICKAVTDKEVDAAIRLGAHSVAAVSELTSAGTDCGCCTRAIEDRVRGIARLGGACGNRCADCPRIAQDSATAA